MTTKTSNHEQLISILRTRFHEHPQRHPKLDWTRVEAILKASLSTDKALLRALSEMENSGGEPDVIVFDQESDSFAFADCAAESPAGRRSLCYDDEALEARKTNKPNGSAVEKARQMGAKLMNETQYLYLQTLGRFDTKTSSWLLTPPDVRVRGGAIFGDRRYERVFIYHNGAESYYAARGFRCVLEV